MIPLSWLEGAGGGFDEGRRRPLVVSLNFIVDGLIIEG
jgi:hypothetical protein